MIDSEGGILMVSKQAPIGLSDRLGLYIGGGYSLSDLLTADDIRYIRGNMETTRSPLYRIEGKRHTAEGLSNGSEFSFSGVIRSFTRDKGVTESMLDDSSDDYAGTRNPVVFETQGTVKHFNLSGYSGFYAAHASDQKESLVGGTWMVSDVSTFKMPSGDMIPLYKIRQICADALKDGPYKARYQVLN